MRLICLLLICDTTHPRPRFLVTRTGKEIIDCKVRKVLLWKSPEIRWLFCRSLILVTQDPCSSPVVLLYFYEPLEGFLVKVNVTRT